MKIIRAAFWLLLIVLLLVPCAAICANAVPKEVLLARSALARVCCEKEDGSAVCGTGFAVGEGEPITFIVTNRHVTQDSTAISVLCADALKVDASVYLENENTDLCVLKLSMPLHGLKPLVMEDTGKTEAGDAIYALGFPSASDVISLDISAAAEDVTVTDGIISAIKTGKLWENGASVTLLQINASLSGGNSGGPLLSENGYVVGVNTLAMPDAQDINAAVSTDTLALMLDAAGISYLSASKQNAAHTTTVIFTIVAGTVIIAAGIITLLRRKKRNKKEFVDISRHNAMRQIEDELKAMLPVVEQVRELHRKGRYGLDICPQNIVISKNGAMLRIKRIKLNAGGGITPYPGYSAPEWYTDGAVGPWTDVYAVSALVYKAMTGRILPPAFERSDETPLFDSLIEKYQPLADAISEGLALEISHRLSSLDALYIKVQACLIGFNSVPAAQNRIKSVKNQMHNTPAVSQQAANPEKMSSKKKMAITGIVIGVLLLGGIWLVNEVNYAQSVSYIESGAYAKAQRSLKGVFSFYGDAAQLSRYTEAGRKLENGEYEAAVRLFSELGNYRDASRMVSETVYHHAQYLMQQGDYASAETLLDTLGEYKDTAQMRTEILYQNACTYLDAGLYLSALDVFGAIDPYNDSADRMDEARTKLYEAGLCALSAGDTDLAASSFAAIPGYEQSDAYVLLCSLLTRAQGSGVFSQEEYETFLGLAEFMDLTPYLTCDALITHYLCGSWRDDKDNLFIMEADGNVQYNLPGMEGGAYSFGDGVLYITQSDGTDAPMFGFTCVDLNTMALYCYEDGMTYMLTRQ